MSAALDAVRYCGEYLSDNIVRTPEGYLICKNAVIARTGMQEYAVSEIQDKERLLKDVDQSGKVNLYRPAEQVFAPATIASFEGATFTVTHPNEFLNPRNDRDHSKGHVQNVRKGDDPLESGEWPLLADIFVKDEQAINAIASGTRELSCGYNYQLIKNGERYEMHNIIGNHVALVDSARAGEEARINDSLPPKETNVTNWKKFLIGMGFKEFAKTETDPEKISAAMDAVAAATKEEGKVEPPESQLDAEAPENFKKMQVEGKDVDFYWDSMNNKPVPIRGSKGYSKSKAGDSEEERKARDDDFGKRMHDALETLLKKREEGKASQDADMGELQKLWSEYLGEEGKEPEHQGNAELKPIETSEKKPADDDDDKKGKDDDDKAKGKDAEIVHPEPKLEAGEVPESQFDSALLVLKSLRPFVARKNPDATLAAFNKCLDAVNAGIKKEASLSGGTQADFLAATRGKARDSQGNEIAPSESRAQKLARETDDHYAQQRKARTAQTLAKK